MAFAGSLQPVRKRSAAADYDAWLDSLPEVEREAVIAALGDRDGWPHIELKARLEADADNPAPAYGNTAFREWRATRGVQ